MKRALKLPNFVSIEYKRHNASSEKSVPQPQSAPPRQNWSARGADGQPAQVKDGQRIYPRNDARQRNPTNPAWKPTARPNPINPSADVSKEAEGGQTSFWVKSLKEKQKETPAANEANGVAFVKTELAAAWRSKDKKPSTADVAKTWARGKSTDAVDD